MFQAPLYPRYPEVTLPKLCRAAGGAPPMLYLLDVWLLQVGPGLGFFLLEALGRVKDLPQMVIDDGESHGNLVESFKKR